jgi:hypothetical protein
VATYLDMQTRIADELDRSELTSQIKKAIVSAVKHYERKTFYFSETSFTFATVAGQRNYGSADAAAIATAPSIEILNGSFYGTRVPLDKVAFDDIDQKTSMTITRAMPEEWAYRTEEIWLYPVPDAVYTITAYHIPRLTELSADADTNAWTNDAEELIRSRAKIDLLRNVIRGTDMEAEIVLLKDQEQEALTALITETASRKGTGFARPTQF